MLSDIDMDEQHLADLEHEACVQFTYGDDVILLSNFNNKDKNKITELISEIKSIFIGTAFVLNGIPYDGMFGVYSHSIAGAKEFWKTYDEL